MKASGNAGFIGVSQRPSQAPSAFLGGTASLLLAFPAAALHLALACFQLHELEIGSRKEASWDSILEVQGREQLTMLRRKLLLTFSLAALRGNPPASPGRIFSSLSWPDCTSIACSCHGKAAPATLWVLGQTGQAEA